MGNRHLYIGHMDIAARLCTTGDNSLTWADQHGPFKHDWNMVSATVQPLDAPEFLGTGGCAPLHGALLVRGGVQ